jgi:predicted alpha/beta-hydrolase family hydrolase
VEIQTAAGPGLADVDDMPRPAFLLVMTHGAGGGVNTADVRATRTVALELGGAVALVTQPYRVRGARAPGSAERQDAAWLELIAALRARYGRIPLVQGGRSNGARVACRTAQAAGAAAVVALAFPLHPPGKSGRPEYSRAGELRQAGVPVLVVNGDRDPFGVPAVTDVARLVVLNGETHSLARRPDAIAVAVTSWLREVIPALGAGE